MFTKPLFYSFGLDYIVSNTLGSVILKINDTGHKPYLIEVAFRSLYHNNPYKSMDQRIIAVTFNRNFFNDFY
jgi:hypothetical protein